MTVRVTEGEREKEVQGRGMFFEPCHRSTSTMKAISIHWRDLHNKVLPSRASIVNGSMKNVWRLLCYQ